MIGTMTAGDTALIRNLELDNIIGQYFFRKQIFSFYFITQEKNGKFQGIRGFLLDTIFFWKKIKVVVGDPNAELKSQGKSSM